MKSDKLVEDLESIILNAKQMPFTNKKVVSEEEVLQIIDELKETLPEELVQSKQIIAEREKILADAKQHADNMIIQAKDYIAKLTEEHELVRQAQERAQQILAQANASSEELKGSSITYAGDVLKYVETTLEKTLFSI